MEDYKDSISSTKKRLLKYLLIGALFIIILISSELLYMFTKAPKRLSFIYLYLTKKSIVLDNPKQSFLILNKAANFQIAENNIFYHNNQIRTDLFCGVENLDDYTKNLVFQYLKDNIVVRFDNGTANRLSNIYYHLGLITQKESYISNSVCFLQLATFLNPELSFLHIELANLYLLENDVPNATKVLSDCLMYQWSHNHCQEYLDYNIRSNDLINFGYFGKTLDEYQIPQFKTN